MLLSLLRLPSRKWSQCLDKCQNRFPRNEQEYRHLESLLVREHTLEETRQQMTNVRNPMRGEQWGEGG
eukprot:2788008-Amphidinium_carterae.1